MYPQSCISAKQSTNLRESLCLWLDEAHFQAESTQILLEPIQKFLSLVAEYNHRLHPWKVYTRPGKYLLWWLSLIVAGMIFVLKKSAEYVICSAQPLANG